MNHLSKILFFSGLLFLSVTACKKDSETTEDTDYTTSLKVSESESIMQDAVFSADDAFDGTDDGMTNGKVAACASITYNETAKTVAVDFGSGCTGVGGAVRSGKITIVFEGTRAVSTKRTMTFDNYTVKFGSNSYTLSGTITSSLSAVTGGYSYTLTGTNISLKLSSGKSFTVNSLSRTIVFSWGGDKKIPSGYTLSISGSSTNTDDTGTTTSVTIDSANPVVLKGSCMQSGIYYPSSGNYLITDGKISYSVSWGTGTCDKEIQITALGKTVTKTLP
jgi:hypothetical protein